MQQKYNALEDKRAREAGGGASVKNNNLGHSSKAGIE